MLLLYRNVSLPCWCPGRSRNDCSHLLTGMPPRLPFEQSFGKFSLPQTSQQAWVSCQKKQYMGLPWTAMDQCHEVTWHFNPQHQISPRSTRSIRPNDLVLVAARIVRAVPHAVTLLAPQGAPMELWIWISACVVYTLPLQQIAKWIQLGKTMNNSYSNHYVLLSILSISTSPLDP